MRTRVQLEALAVALDDQVHRIAAGQRDLDAEVLEAVHRLAADLEHAVTGLQRDFPGRAAVGDPADLGGEEGDAAAKRDRERDQREQQVHHHAAGVEQHALADGLALQALAARVAAVARLHAGDGDVAAERDQREPVVGRAAVEAPDARAEAEREDLDAHADPASREVVPELVHVDQEPDAEGDEEDVAEFAHALVWSGVAE